MIKIDEEKIKCIREGLEEHNYDIYYQRINGEINYHINPWSSYEEVIYRLNNYEKKIRIIFKLLLLSEEVIYTEAIECCGKSFIDALIDVGFLERDKDALFGKSFSIISYYGFFFVVDTFPEYPNGKGEQKVYIGSDTYRLCASLPKKNGEKVLDLCTGSGIQGIVEASYCKELVLVEKNEEVIPITRFNTILNQCAEKTKVVCSDLYSNVNEEKYDLITANPPFIPVPENVYFPGVGDGGEDGLKVIVGIIEGLDDYLKVGGTCRVIGECLGDEESTLLFKKIKVMLPIGYKCNLFLQARNSKSQYIESVINLYKKQIDEEIDEKNLKYRFEDLFKKLVVNSYYMFLLDIKKCENEESEFKQIKNYSIWEDEIFPLISEEVDFASDNENCKVYFKTMNLGTVPRRIERCLKDCNGSSTIDQIVERYCGNEYGATRQIFETVCEALEKVGAMCHTREIKGSVI
ncbi:methylase of polypeptide subunit release factors [Lachnospiraceae bacterium PF1-21]